MRTIHDINSISAEPPAHVIRSHWDSTGRPLFEPVKAGLYPLAGGIVGFNVTEGFNDEGMIGKTGIIRVIDNGNVVTRENLASYLNWDFCIVISPFLSKSAMGLHRF